MMIVETHLQIETQKKTFTFRNEFSLKMKSRRQLANFEFCKLIRSVSKMLQKKLVQKGRNSRKSHLHFNIYIFLAVLLSQKKIMSNMHKFINLIHKHMCALKHQILEHRKKIPRHGFTNHLHKSHFRRKLPKLFCEGA